MSLKLKNGKRKNTIIEKTKIVRKRLKETTFRKFFSCSEVIRHEDLCCIVDRYPSYYEITIFKNKEVIGLIKLDSFHINENNFNKLVNYIIMGDMFDN